MYKFFVNSNQINEDIINIIGNDVNHIKNVLRINIGEEIYICNKDNSNNYLCKINEFIDNEIKCIIINKVKETTETKNYIHIFQGLPKSDKLEFIIEKCSEIGVKEITPVIMKRSIVKIENKDRTKKEERWRKIAEVAAKQSKRDIIMKVNSIINFKNIFENIEDYDIVLLAYENEKNKTLKNVLQSLNNSKENLKIAVIIGPEGGIDQEELDIIEINNIIPITLGKRILRTETAPIVVASNILYELEE